MMMYTIQPVIDQYWDYHTGFYIVTLICLGITGFIVTLWNAKEVETSTLGMWIGVLLLVVGIAHDNSYQPQKFYANTQVVGEFVRFQPEGYNEQSGKSRADHHYMYVVYEIEGSYAIFQTNASTTWPKRAVFYRNPTK